MRHTFTFLQDIHDKITAHIASGDGKEMAGYIFAGVSQTASEIRFVGREFWPVKREHIIHHNSHRMSICSDSYCPALQHADQTRQSFWFVHSHPHGHNEFSDQDDVEEPMLFRTAYTRIRSSLLHGSIVFPEDNSPIGRVWLDETVNLPLDRIRVVGDRFRIYDVDNDSGQIPEFFDRQVRAFGADIQRLLARLHVAVVGCGGTGSAVCEQLIRLGVGTLSIFDPQTFAVSNVNRVYGSSTRDDRVPKVDLLRRLAEHIGVGTKINSIHDSVYREHVAKQLREADFIFGCTDEDAARGILSQIAVRYAIPVIDVGVLIDSEDQRIKSVTGRVTVLFPGASCLYCRGRIDAKRAAHDMTRFFNPAEATAREQEGYAPELMENNPAVIPFTTSVACGATSELLHRLTGFMGSDRKTTELIYQFDQNEIRRNSHPPRSDCFCSDARILGRADGRMFLGVTWP